MADGRRNALVLPALLGLVGLILVVGAAAPAEGKLTFRSEVSGEFAAGSKGSARAKCPSGKRRHLISGGFASNSPWRADDNSTMAIFSSRQDGSRGWRVSAANFAGEPETITASVLCGKRDPKVRVDRDGGSLPPAGEKKFTARCKRGEEAISGGFSATGFVQNRGPEVVVIESRRKGRRKWRVSAYNNSGTIGGELIAYARCAKRGPGLRPVKVKGTAVDQTPLELKPKCEKGSELWSGGFVGDFQAFDPFATIIADRSYADGRKWVSRFVGFQTGGEVTALAYCRERG